MWRGLWRGCGVSVFVEGDAEAGALVWDGVFEGEVSAVVVVDDAAGECETESPSALFGGEA